MRNLIDTHTPICAHKNLGGGRSRLDGHDAHRLCMGPLNLYELGYGMAKSSQAHGLQLLLNNLQARFDLVPFNAAAAPQAARVPRLTIENWHG